MNQHPSENIEINVDMQKEFSHEQWVNREYSLHHLDFNREFSFYNAVQQGNIEEVKKIMLPLNSEELGKLSTDPLRNIRYHFVITIALITRFCIEAGMQPEEAYTLSDIYIQKVDRSNSTSEVSALHQKAILEFTTRMHELQKERHYSAQTLHIMDYIYNNLHDHISLDDMAETLQISKSYMCNYFKKETGSTIGDYILKEKIVASENMLKYSEYSAADIANYLGFTSQSYFIACFKKITGTTPRQYRLMHFRKNFTE